MRSLAGAGRAAPFGIHRKHAGQGIEAALLHHESPVARAPPIVAEKARGDAIATRSVPCEHPAGAQHPSELADDADVVGRVGEEPKGREQVHDGVEPARPFLRQGAHIRACVSQRVARAPLFGFGEQLRRVVRAVDVVAGLREQMGVPALAARTIQNARADGQLEDVDQPADLTAIAGEIEERFVLEEIPLVEERRPPIGRRFGQKKTGSL
jgi:hypothetical protein